jgi:peptidoglycan hydrolase-like protein with peptidoglycan-binding domain
MARCPFAQWNPVSFSNQLAQMPAAPKAVFLHTNGGGANLTPWFDSLWRKKPEGIGSTFQIFNDGSIDQLCDTDRVIWAQYGASRWAVSIETEDDGHPNTPWTPAQLAAIQKLIKWLNQEHQIPLRAMANENDSGIGYHQQFSVYNKSGHSCPGPVRVNQLRHTVIPRLGGVLPAVGDHTESSHAPQPRGALPLPWMRKDPDTHTWQVQMLARGWSKIGTPDGVYGANAKAVCRDFQREKGVPVTGTVDEHTWALAWTTPITR